MTKLSVFIPTYNRVQYLQQAIESVLSQTFKKFKLVVVDNASKDQTQVLCKSINDPRFSYHCNERNLGMVGNWQRCLDLCDTEWFAMLEDDNLWESDFLSRVFCPNHGCVLMHSGAAVFSDMQGKIYDRPTYWMQQDIRERILMPWQSTFWQSFCSQIAASSAIYKTSVARFSGGYDSMFPAAQDWFLLSRIGRHGLIYSVNAPLMHYRLHETRASIDNKVKQQIRIDSMQIAYDNLIWSLRQPELTHERKMEIISSVPGNQLYGLLEVIVINPKDELSRNFAKTLWKYIKECDGNRPKAVRLFGKLGYLPVSIFWNIKNRF